MIKIIEKDLFNSNANIIVHQVNTQGVMGSGVAGQVSKKYPHVYKEYRSYVHHCQKNGVSMMGKVQYVPVDVWALGLVDTTKNQKIIPYDRQYQYIANAFGQKTYGKGLQTDINSLTNCFMDIQLKAEQINASIAIPYKIGCCRGGADWNVVYKIIQEVFDGSDLDVMICKYDLG